MLKLTSVIDIGSIDDSGHSADSDAVAKIVENAIECGFLFPPIVVMEGNDEGHYLLEIGINHLEAAKKLCFKDRENFDDRVLCFVVTDGDVESMRSQIEYFGADEL